MRRQLIVTIALLTLTAGMGPAAGAVAATSTTSSTAATDAPGGCEYPIELEDATGESITIDDEPDSIVALYPSDAQKVFKVGADDRLDGMPVSEYTEGLDVDDQTDTTEDDGLTPVPEEIIALEPDVVLAASIADEEIVDQLREAGIDVYVFDVAMTLEDVQTDVQTAGQLTGSCDGAGVAAEWMDERMAILEDALEDEDRPLALYAMGDGYTAGEFTFQDEVLTSAGVENLGAEAGIEGWDIISDETVLEEDPEWIIYGETWGDEPPVSDAHDETTAMQEGQYFGIDDSDVSQPAPKTVYAVEEIVAGVHPDLYEDVEAELEAVDEAYESALADLEAADDEPDTDDADSDGADDDTDTTADDEETDPPADDDDATETDDSIPGFGVPVAIAGVLSLLFVRLRRL